MPYRSNSQRRYFYAAEKRGELPKGTAAEWEAHTPKNKKLPERLHAKKKQIKKSSALVALAQSGDEIAQLAVAVIKQSTVGRHEGFGATNSTVTANSGLLSASNLAKPPQVTSPPAGQLQPGINAMTIGKTPSTIVPGNIPQPGVGMPASGITSASTPPPRGVM
jgi:hypothetical protein